MVNYLNTLKIPMEDPIKGMSELRKEMTKFLQSKGFDSYIRGIDGDPKNRELIVFKPETAPKVEIPAGKEAWEMTKEEFENKAINEWYKGKKFINKEEQLRNIRKQSIENAIEQGETIPPEVLADYPDLQAKVKPESKGADEDIKTIKTFEDIANKSEDYQDFKRILAEMPDNLWYNIQIGRAHV